MWRYFLFPTSLNVSVQWWASPRQYTVDPLLLPSANPIKCHEEVLSLQHMMPSKRFDIFPPDWGVPRRSRCVQIFLYIFLETVDLGFTEEMAGFRCETF